MRQQHFKQRLLFYFRKIKEKKELHSLQINVELSDFVGAKEEYMRD